MPMAKVEALKRRLGDGEVIPYAELLRACEEAGAARTSAEAPTLAAVLDEAGVVLLFRDVAFEAKDMLDDFLHLVETRRRRPSPTTTSQRASASRKRLDEISASRAAYHIEHTASPIWAACSTTTLSV